MKFEKRRKSKFKSKLSLKANFIKFLFQYRIQMEEDHVNFPSFAIFMLQLISCLQYAGIIIIQYHTHMSEQNIVGEFKILFIISKLARPYLYLLEYDPKVREVLFLVPFIILIVFITTQFFIHILKNKENKNDKTKNQHIYLSYIIAYFYSVYIPLFNIPFLDMTLLSLQNIESNNIISSLFACICIIMEISVFIFCFITNETINIRLKNYFVLNQTLVYYWIHFIIYLGLTINNLKLERHAQFYILFTLNLIEIILKIWDSFNNYANLYRRVVTDICLGIYNFLIIILIFINTFRDGPSNDNIIFIYMIYPILAYITIQYFKKIHNEAMLNNSLKLSPKIIQYRIATILDQYRNINRSYYKSSYHVVRINLYLKYHSEVCNDLKCGCDAKNITLEQIINYYLRNQVNEFGESIISMKDLSNQFQFYLHYLSFISYLGMNTSALKQSNLMLFESQTNSISQFGTVSNNNQLTERRQSSSSNAKSRISKESLPHIKLKSLNALQKIKLSIIQSTIRQFMNSEFQTTDKSLQDNLQHAVKLFLQSEQNNQQLKHKLMKLIIKKRDFYSKLLLFKNNFNLFEQCKELVTKLQSFEDQINQLYNKFPSQKMQALSAFFQAEIRNNYFIAYKLSNLTSISDEKLLKMQAQTTFNLFTHKVVYLLIGFDEKSHHLKVINSSNLCFEFFGITNEQFHMMQTLEYLLPTGFQNMHDIMVQQFLVDSVSKYFRTANISFCSVGFQAFKSTNFFYDIDSSQQQLEDLKFACFFEDYEDQNAYLIVNSHQSVVSVSKNFGNKLGYSKKVWVPASNSLLKVNIGKIIDKFKDYVDAIILEERSNGEIIVQLDQIFCYFPKHEILMQFEKINWELYSHKTQYILDILLHFKFVQSNLLYYIVEIRDAKQEQFMTSRNTSNLDDFDDIQSVEIFNEEIANFPNVIQNVNESFFNNQDQFGVKMEIKKQSLVALNSSKSFMHPNVSLVSPKNQDQKLLFDGSNAKKQQSQQYFQDEKYYEKSESAEGNMELEKNIRAQNKVDQLQMDDIDLDLQQNIKMQMQMVKEDQNIVQIDDIGSCVSSIAGLKKSKFFKKYELIEKLISSRKFSINFNRMVQFILLFIIFSLTIQAINIYKSQVDFNRFLQELDMVQIRSNLMGPVDKFIVSQFAALNYLAGALFFNYMTLAEALEKFQYANADVQYSYQELKLNFNSQLQNSYLLPFFQDQYMNVTQNNYPSISYRNVSIKEALFLYLEASFNFINIDFANVFGLDLNQSFFVFAFGNYISFTNLFKNLNKKILIYSQQRSIVVAQDWINILIPSIIISAFIIGITYIFYQRYLLQYDKILEMFTIIDNVWMQRDMERYKGILSLLSKDSDVVFKYTFDLDLKESFLQAEDQRKEKIALNQKEQKTKLHQNQNKKRFKISYWPSLIVFVGIFGVYFSFILLTNQLAQNYFGKYPQTTQLFNILSDLSVASSGVFATKQLAYGVQIEGFFFFTEGVSDIQLLQLFFENIEIINEFLILYNSFDQSSYLSSQAFYNQMVLLMQDDVCKFLPEYKRQSAQIHCDVVFEGVLRRGYEECLIKVRDSLLNEYEQSKNFTIQVFQLEEQFEIGLIGYDVINVLRQQFKSELVNYTSNLSSQILIINLSYIFTSLMGLVILIFVVRQYFVWEFKIMKQTILLLPQASLFLDAQLDREIRQIIIKYNMI